VTIGTLKGKTIAMEQDHLRAAIRMLGIQPFAPVNRGRKGTWDVYEVKDLDAAFNQAVRNIVEALYPV
jgi:hypothetical protein